MSGNVHRDINICLVRRTQHLRSAYKFKCRYCDPFNDFEELLGDLTKKEYAFPCDALLTALSCLFFNSVRYIIDGNSIKKLVSSATSRQPFRTLHITSTTMRNARALDDDCE
ncbi:hypothetical protein ACJMK2_007139 [Sinanodonta woodiana]|uniref:Uncharacterized protein n=1 Tax=Sinanodonta woodiana TaxID=1069815 RepID=A0ABD3VJ27_SINWO